MKPGEDVQQDPSFCIIAHQPPVQKLWIWNVVHLIMIRVASIFLSFHIWSLFQQIFYSLSSMDGVRVSIRFEFHSKWVHWTVSEVQNGFSSSPSSSAAVSCVSPHIEVLLPPFLPPLLPLDGCSRMYLLFLRTILSKFFEGSVSAITTHLFSLFAA